VIVLSLGVLAAALVDLAGSSSPTKIQVTRIVTTVASVASPATATTTPPPRATTPAATTPSASTLAAVPAVRLAPVTTLTSSAATLNGLVNPQGVPTTYLFQYGARASYGARAPASPVSLGAGTSAIAVSVRITNLTPGTTYRYNLIASKAGRAISTGGATFTTSP
jgi:hypothetical protein